MAVRAVYVTDLSVACQGVRRSDGHRTRSDDRGKLSSQFAGLCLLTDRITGKEVWRRLRAANCVGVTRGTLEERRSLAPGPALILILSLIVELR